MRRMAGIVFISAVLTVQYAAHCQSGVAGPSLSNKDDYAKAEKDHRYTGVTPKFRNLHDYPLRSDGSKGYNVTSTGFGIGRTAANLAPFQSEGDFNLHGAACGSTAIVVGTFVGSESHLSKNKNTIFTRNHFLIESVIRSGPGVFAGGDIDVIELGGSVVDEGERLNVVISGVVPFKIDERYILFLDHDSSASFNAFYLGLRLNVEGGKIADIKGDERSFVINGESIDDFKRRVGTVLAIGPCF